ncbi:transporter substrate-binding domain-containing protein [Planctobacterium marinum]|uniref:Solute-binding protein family 3/N-terminal domain-containing protein n=1 Tax=Planctobacterium marinum TaxID=1631968 RepID=A0AA48HNY9_9ALTE|nr:hypothetical protein MACH26_08300 [Planctobacterium marinum]
MPRTLSRFTKTISKPHLIALMLLLQLPWHSALAANSITWAIAHYPPRFVIEAPGKFGGQAGLQHEILEAALPQYQHVYKQYSYASFAQALLKQEPVCTSMILKTPEREMLAAFSIPWHIDLPIALAITRDAWQRIGSPKTVLFKDVIQDERIKGGIEQKRSYGVLDDLIKDLAINKNLDKYELIASQILPLLQTGGIDYTLEYPYLAEYYLRNIKTRKDIISVPIEDGFDYVFGYIACTKNDWGQALIKRLNEVIREERQKQGYLNLLKMLYRSDSDRAKMESIYYQHFLASEE